MANCSLQEAEKVYIIHGVQDGMRNDGRGRLDYRIIELETDVLPNTNGSALVKIEQTKVIAGVKAEHASPKPQCPDKGWIEVSIENTPCVNLEFGGRGGDDFATNMSQILTQVCNNDKLVDLKKLCILEGQQVWVLYVDIMIIEYGGNFIDAVSMATKAALFSTKLPNAHVETNGDAPEIEFTEDPHDLFSLDVTDLPCLITLNRIGNEFVIDATKEEEACTRTKVVLGVSSKELVLKKEMDGPGSLHTDSINEAAEIGEEIGIKLQKRFNETLQLEKKLPKKKKCLSI